MVVKDAAAGGRGRRWREVSVAVTGLDGLPAAWPAVAAVKVKWRRPATGALPELLMGRRWGRGVTAVEPVAGGAVWWPEAGEANRFRFDVAPAAAVPDPSGGSDWDISFSVLYGFQEGGRGKAKDKEKDSVRLEEIGAGTMSLEECLAMQQQQKAAAGEEAAQELAQVAQEKQVPITLTKEGCGGRDAIATLYVKIEIVEPNQSREIKRSLSVQQHKPKPRTMHDHDLPSLLDSPASHEAVLDLDQLLELADREDKVAVYRTKRNSDSSSSSSSVSTSGRTSPEAAAGSTSKRRLLPWRRRSRDFDKRCSDSSSSSQELPKKCTDEDPGGSWERREFISRDGETKLKTEVFFASIDQRAESAGGESACTALVAVLAAALHMNRLSMPTRAEFDALIREGSSEWRRLCANAAYMERFPNKHFDLDTVLAAAIRPVAVLPERAFVGFFRPECFRSLAGAMSFDAIWDEISTLHGEGDGHAEVFIVSWNDHFFVVKAEQDAYYVIDTLGERLFEGCTKAYMLRFDGSSEMYELPEKAAGGGREKVVVATGKECCREFIKRFLAAIPVREELQIEMNGGDGGGCAAPHRRLQIEFHCTVLKGEGERSG